MQPLMILVAGPYRSGTNDDPSRIAENVAAMTAASLALFRAGHLPVPGEWYALPLIEHAGSQRIGDEVFNEIFHPIARRIVDKCDGCLRTGGPSNGADEWSISPGSTESRSILPRRYTRCDRLLI